MYLTHAQALWISHTLVRIHQPARVKTDSPVSFVCSVQARSFLRPRRVDYSCDRYQLHCTLTLVNVRIERNSYNACDLPAKICWTCFLLRIV